MAAPAAIAAGASIGSTLLGNKGAQQAANSAANDRRNLTARATRLFDAMMGNVSKYDQQGGFDPSRRIAQMESEGKRDLAIASRVQKGDAMQTGHRAGDSYTTQGADNLSMRFARDMATNRDSIRNDAFWDRMRAYGAVNGSLLEPGIAGANQDYANAAGRMQNPAGVVASAWPNIFPPKSQTASGTGGGGATSGGSSTPFGFNMNNYLQPIQVGGYGSGGGNSFWSNYFPRGRS